MKKVLLCVLLSFVAARAQDPTCNKSYGYGGLQNRYTRSCVNSGNAANCYTADCNDLASSGDSCGYPYGYHYDCSRRDNTHLGDMYVDTCGSFPGHPCGEILRL